MTVRDKLINNFAIKGYVGMDNAEAEVCLAFDRQGIRRATRREKEIASSIHTYTNTNDDIVFYCEKAKDIYIAEPIIKDMRIKDWNIRKIR
jgi:formate-dependent phosphoribosylglycinamide formyltransferase (GAR transformylase)